MGAQCVVDREVDGTTPGLGRINRVRVRDFRLGHGHRAASGDRLLNARLVGQHAAHASCCHQAVVLAYVGRRKGDDRNAAFRSELQSAHGGNRINAERLLPDTVLKGGIRIDGQPAHTSSLSLPRIRSTRGISLIRLAGVLSQGIAGVDLDEAVQPTFEINIDAGRLDRQGQVENIVGLELGTRQSNVKQVAAFQSA